MRLYSLIMSLIIFLLIPAQSYCSVDLDQPPLPNRRHQIKTDYETSIAEEENKSADGNYDEIVRSEEAIHESQQQQQEEDMNNVDLGRLPESDENVMSQENQN